MPILQMTQDNLESAMSIGIQRIDASLNHMDLSEMLQLAQGDHNGLCGTTLNMRGCPCCATGGYGNESGAVADMAYGTISMDVVYTADELQTLLDFEGFAALRFFTTQDMFREMLENTETIFSDGDTVQGAAWQFVLSIENGEVVLTP